MSIWPPETNEWQRRYNYEAGRLAQVELVSNSKRLVRNREVPKNSIRSLLLLLIWRQEIRPPNYGVFKLSERFHTSEFAFNANQLFEISLFVELCSFRFRCCHCLFENGKKSMEKRRGWVCTGLQTWEREREIYGEGATMRSSNHQWLSISSLSPLIRMWSCSLNDDLLQLLLRGPHACSGDVSIDESLAFWMSLYLSTQLSFLFLRRILSLTLLLILILILHVPVVALFSTACSYDCAVIVVVLVSCASFVSPSSPS